MPKQDIVVIKRPNKVVGVVVRGKDGGERLYKDATPESVQTRPVAKHPERPEVIYRQRERRKAIDMKRGLTPDGS